MCLLVVTSVCEFKDNISNAFFKYGDYYKT